MSIKKYTLYVNTNAVSPRTALVTSANNLTQKGLGTVVAGDTMDFIIIPVNENGVDTAVAGTGTYSIQTAIGAVNSMPYATSSNMKASASYGWTGSINTDTGSLLSAIGSNASITAYFEIELTDTGSYLSGSKTTILQVPMTLLNQVIPNS